MNTNNSAFYRKILGCLLGGLIGDAMGAPVEGWDYEKIIETYGEVSDFSGEGTDDSYIKGLLCKAIFKHDGEITADEFAQSFLENVKDQQGYDLFYIPVKNMYHKIQDNVCLPIDAGYGNMQSSSSAMAISPMGIINACNPRQAAMEAYEVAGLIHSGPTSFCRDAASAIAASVAEAFRPSATVQSVIAASTAYLHQKSSHVMIKAINDTLELAAGCGDYSAFREKFYNSSLKQNVICDSRETVPCALAMIQLSQGDPAQSIVCSANFGRDSDTIGTMAGAIAGALRGVEALPTAWVDKIKGSQGSQEQTAERLLKVALLKAGKMKEAAANIDDLNKQ